MTCDVLVTGFGPFPQVRINPTAALARVVARRVGGRALVLQTSYGKGLGDLGHALDTLRPAAVLMLGLAARSRRVRIETCARPGSSRLAVDISGRTPEDAPLGARSPLPVRSTASTGQALATLQAHGIAARLSASAGRYLCNAAYGAALAHARLAGVPVLFIHIPYPRPPAGTKRRTPATGERPSHARLGAALGQIATGLQVAARRPLS